LFQNEPKKPENVLNTKICADLNSLAFDPKFSQIVDTYKIYNFRLKTKQMRPGGPSKTEKPSENKKIRENISASEGSLGLIY